MDWVLIIFGTQVIKKKRPVRPVFPDYLSVSYDYDGTRTKPFIVFTGAKRESKSLYDDLIDKV